MFINGKFTAQRTTGVQRVAAQLVRALDDFAAPLLRRVLLCPPGAVAPTLRHIEVQTLGAPGLPLHVWEQSALPLAARHGLLLSLAGSAPFFARRQALLLHDAAVFDHPQAYTPAFAGWYRLLFRRLGRRAVSLFTVSAFARERLALRLGVEASRFTVLTSGAEHLDGVLADRGILQRLGLFDQGYLLAVGSANPTKNLPALVAAFARLPARAGMRLVIVGGGNERVFAAAPAAPPDPPGVLRTGPLDDAQLKALYQHALALVFPSISEGFGLPPLEAMANGCPALVANAAAIPEVCADAALYFDPHDIGAIVAALERVVGDEALRDRLRAAGQERAAKFRWAAAAAGLATALTAPGVVA